MAKNAQAWTGVGIRSNRSPVISKLHRNARAECTVKGSKKDIINMKSFGPSNCNEICLEYKKKLRNVMATIASVVILTSPITMDIDLNWNANMNTKTISNMNKNSPNIRHLPVFTCIIQASRQEALAISLTENQRFVSDVWFAVTAQYFDPTFNNLGEAGWKEQKLKAISAVADTGPDEEDQIIVYQAIQNMLSSLDDPYTRFLDKNKYEAITAYARGGSLNSGQIGVQLLFDPRLNDAIAASVVEGGPAEKGGMKRGDVILELDGESMDGASAEVVAAKCKGEIGSNINVVVLHRPEDAGGNDEITNTILDKRNIQELSIKRDTVKLNPVKISTFMSTRTESKVGVMTIPAFTQETVKQTIDSMRKLQQDNVQVFAIDLRGNVGGYMPAGIDAAKLFLAGGRRIVAEVNQGGQITAYYSDGIGAETSIPLYILVDEKTASASEIFSAALQDNRRAKLVGRKTFGKGRIQNVQSIGNGCGVAVTRARYVTPLGRDVHSVGIKPDKEIDCGRNDAIANCLSGII